MKRHRSLVPLSREHHDGLVMAQRLILGRSTNPRADWPSTAPGQRGRLLNYFQTELRPHFEFEERHLFPYVAQAARADDGDASLVVELTADHDAMRAMIHELHADPASSLAARLQTFGTRLRAHIRREERHLFERIQRHWEPAALERLGAAVADYVARPRASTACRR